MPDTAAKQYQFSLSITRSELEKIKVRLARFVGGALSDSGELKLHGIVLGYKFVLDHEYFKHRGVEIEEDATDGGGVLIFTILQKKGMSAMLGDGAIEKVIRESLISNLGNSSGEKKS